MEEVGDHVTLADVVAECQECKHEPPRKPVGFVSAEELEAAIAQALQSGPRWRRRQRGSR